jgi:hypothetical protein
MKRVEEMVDTSKLLAKLYEDEDGYVSLYLARAFHDSCLQIAEGGAERYGSRQH